MSGYVSLHVPSALCLTLSGDIKVLYFGLGIVAATGGLIGSISQLFLWSRHLSDCDQRRKPSSNPHVVFSLALSNFISCAGTLLLVFFMLFTNDSTVTDAILQHSPKWHIYFVIPSQLILNVGFVLSWMWTLLYILDVCLQVYGYSCRVKIYHCIAWPFAAIMVLACEMLRYHSLHERHCSEVERLFTIATVWASIWGIIGLSLLIGLVVLERKIKRDVYSLSNAFTVNERTLYKRIRVKFLVFVIAFFVCWLPTLLCNLIFLVDRKDDFKSELWVVEVILNPLQGAFNYFIFIPQTRLHDLVPLLPGRKEAVLSQDGFCRSIESMNQQSCENHNDNNCLLARPRPTPIDSSFFHFTPHNRLDTDDHDESQCVESPTDSITTSYESTTSGQGTAYLVRLLGDEYPSL